MRNILLAGGGGYIGAVVAQYLIDKGNTVTVLDNLIYGQNIGVSHLFSHQATTSHMVIFRTRV